MEAIWQWWNWYESLVAPGKQILRINMDETAVKLYFQQARGLVHRRVGGGKSCKTSVHNVSRRQQRSTLSHVAFICDDTAIQPLMPHVLVGNDAVLPLYVQRAERNNLAPNVYLVRRKSAWVDVDLMLQIV